jgi:DNA-binding GntR family transcriptional regulator
LRGFFKKFKTATDFDDLKSYAAEDRRFHNFLVSAGEREFLAGILETYNVITFSYQVDLEEGLVRHPSETIKEHRAIIDAISRKDEEEAEARARQHLKITRKKLESDADSARKPPRKKTMAVTQRL